MESLPPDPEHAAFVEQARQRMRRQRDELFALPVFPVFELVTPEPAARALADSHQADGEWVSISLVYGDAVASGGPWVGVTTSVGEPPGPAEVLADERDRLFDHAGVNEPDPERADEVAVVVLIVDGVELDALLRREGVLWALQAEVRSDTERRSVTVTVVGRGVSSAGIALRRVEDLVPYWEGRAELLSALAAAHPYERPEELDLPPAVGLEAPRALVEAVLVEGAWLTGELRRGRPPSPRRHPVVDMGRLWEASIRAQMQLARQPRERARQSGTAMVNQLASLAEKTEWFSDVALRQAAIDETLAYWVLGREVSSGSTQRAWQRLWEAKQRPPPVTGDTPGINDLATFRAHSETVGALERTWLQAWQRWADTFRG
ncbi:MAG: hypothetical protein GXP34_00785 [Actinobacteria bacterium]|nr:hypothetical protein [Actinomycetota bacterium]